MKKASALVIVLIYFVFSCGLVINLHYCMGSFQSFQLYKIKSDLCGKCGMHMEENNTCCHDELKIIKLLDDQNIGVSKNNPRVSKSSVLATAPVNLKFVFHDKQPLHFNTHSPPLITQQDTYLLNCVFRI